MVTALQKKNKLGIASQKRAKKIRNPEQPGDTTHC